MKSPIALCVGDLHFMKDVPPCRVDDFRKAQVEKLRFLRKLQDKHNIPVLYPGDLFDVWKYPPEILAEFVREAPHGFYIDGQHDLPGHSSGRSRERANVAVLDAMTFREKQTNLDPTFQKASVSGSILSSGDFIVHGFSWGLKLDGYDGLLPSVAMVHRFCYVGDSPWPGCDEMTAEELLDALPDFDLVLVGDNHKQFIFEKNGRILLNPGSVMRIRADQINHQPRAYLWDGDSLEAVDIPIDKEAVSRVRLDQEKEQEDKMDVWVEQLSGDFEISMSFDDNINAFFKENKAVCPKVEKVVRGLCR